MGRPRWTPSLGNPPPTLRGRHASNGIVSGRPRVLLRLEGLLVLVAATAAYARLGSGWWLFAALFFAPDLSMLGYIAGRRPGAVLYNLGHWYGPPLAFVAWGIYGQGPTILAAGLVWAAHIGFDRALGYGLKYGLGFGASHLGSMGQVDARWERSLRTVGR